MQGFTGAPAVEGSRGANVGAWAPRFVDWSFAAAADVLLLEARDDEAGLAVRTTLELSTEGLVPMSTALTNVADTDYVVHAVRSVLPVGAAAAEVLDLTGRWSRERVAAATGLPPGHLGPRRAGTAGPATTPTLVLVAGTPASASATERSGRVHVAWSGDHATYAERTPEGDACSAAASCSARARSSWRRGRATARPSMFASWSDEGSTGSATGFHRWLRAHGAGTRTPRPVVLNTWEAVYFDHDLDRLDALADVAAEVGVERFVLDDGWFRGRRDDHAGLGDWTVDPAVWPQGLHPLIDHVRGLGMDFGLWVEPEMVNLDSDLARHTPTGSCAVASSYPPSGGTSRCSTCRTRMPTHTCGTRCWRCWTSTTSRSSSGTTTATSSTPATTDGRPCTDRPWRSTRLLDELREAHPGLEIETCASGGGRVDLGDPRPDRPGLGERHHRRRSNGSASSGGPRCWCRRRCIGAHVGGPVAHTTGRSHHLDFRAATALLGHFGIEWDLAGVGRRGAGRARGVGRAAQGACGTWCRRSLVRGDHPDPSVLITGVVADDASEAVFVVATVPRRDAQPAARRAPGPRPRTAATGSRRWSRAVPPS